MFHQNDQHTSWTRVQRVIRTVWDRVPFYRRRMEAAGLHPDDFRTPQDLRHFPCTTKNDLRDTYPTGLLACDKGALARFHASSGTTGKPTVVAYTARDLDAWDDMMVRGLRVAGVTEQDIVQIAYGYGLFTGGLGFHRGVEKLGAAVIPASGGMTERQILLMEDLGTTVLCCTPSYALHLGELLTSRGKRLPSLRLGIFGAEPWSEELRKRLESSLGITAVDVYGLSEIMGPGVGMECPYHQGFHTWDDHTYVEIVDPETDEPLPLGSEGCLVITPLTKEALPLVRYKTKDLTRILPDACPCGTSGTRLARITGRSDDMLIIRGVNVFPSQIETALGEIPGLSLHYQMEITHQEGLQDLTVLCEARDTLSAEEIEGLRCLGDRRIHEILGIRVALRVLEPGALPRSEGKAVRIRRAA